MSAGNGEILLSIAIPTKNRREYLVNLIEELLRSDRTDFEIVIADNSDDDSLLAYISTIGDQRVKYRYRKEWISVVDNCDAAISDCSGHYVCMLGDDDGILLEESLGELTNAKLMGIDAIMSKVLLYNWPDLTHHSMSNFGGKLFLRPVRSGKAPSNLLAHARAVVSRGGALGLEGLPCVYHGFISQLVLSKLRSIAGSAFPGPSPDMANAIGICSLLERIRYVPQVLIIAGHSRSSAAGRGARKQHHGAIQEQRHLPADTVENWCPQIPFFWSGPTIYAQSLQSAISRTDLASLGRPGDACLYAACFVFDPSYVRETIVALRRSSQSLWSLLPLVLYYMLTITVRRANNYIHNMISGMFPNGRTVEAASIAEAIRTVRLQSS